jgi:beta-lactamase superfamily II metal-dependent hydrolase
LRILLFPDLGHAGQVALLNHIPNTNDLRADIVVAGVPDQAEPLCDALLDAIQPRVIIIADSDRPATRRAGAALRERLALKGVPVICTHETGAVTLTIRHPRWRLQTMEGPNLEGRIKPVP